MIEAFCWVLIHSFWQGLLFTVLTGIIMVYTKRAGATLRYNLLCWLFFLFLAVCLFTFFREWKYMTQGDIGLVSPLSGQGLSSLVRSLGDYCTTHASLIVLVWGIIFSAKCVKITASLVYTQRVRHYGKAAPADGWKDKLNGYCDRLQIRKTVELWESRLVKIPMVIGHLKPMIFIPLGLLTQLPEGEIEAVLLHELAHIRRNDYLVNLLQHLAENIFFFNPGLLWISALLREEREHCCDDIAIAKTGNKLQFIQALVSFKEHALHGKGLTMGFPAGRHQLLRRVARIAYGQNKAMKTGEKIFFLLSCCILCLLLAANSDTTSKPAENSGGRVMHAGSQQENVMQKAESKPTEEDVADRQEQDRAGTDAEQAAVEAKEAEARAKEAGMDEENAAVDAQQALRDMEQAREDQKQAEEDRRQAELDRLQADKDQEQAQRDKIQAEKDRQQSLREAARNRGDRLKAQKETADKKLSNLL